MRQHNVGDVVVVEDRGGRRVPICIVIDRDLVVEIMAPSLNHEPKRAMQAKILRPDNNYSLNNTCTKVQ